MLDAAAPADAPHAPPAARPPWASVVPPHIALPRDPAHTLPQLADPRRYEACYWGLIHDPERRPFWLDVFRFHWVSLAEHARADAADRGESPRRFEARLAAAAERFLASLDRYAANPGLDGQLDVLWLCWVREAILRSHGIPDPYRLAKQRENEMALRLLPALLAEMDAVADARDRMAEIAKGVFAGNIFDLGATKTLELFDRGQMNFHAALEKLKPRPWLVDGLDDWLDDWTRQPTKPGRALLFVDNAGPDVILGMLPFARELLRGGCSVVLTANTNPALNDVTFDELVPLLRRAAMMDPPLAQALAERRLTALPSGNSAPLIDLTRLSPELVRAAQTGLDLVVLEGMGRGVESNWFARFTCPSIKVAMLKNRGVAADLGGEVYDLVFKYERGD